MANLNKKMFLVLVFFLVIISSSFARYEKDKDGEFWYDENEKLIHAKLADGTEAWYINWKAVHVIHPNGNEIWANENEEIIHHKQINGTESWYDDQGRLLHLIDEYGAECWYDKDGKPIHSIEANGDERWYDKDGNIIHTKPVDKY